MTIPIHVQSHVATATVTWSGADYRFGTGPAKDGIDDISVE